MSLMTESERRQIIASLDEGIKALVDTLHEVSEMSAARTPAPERWSILQCGEHVALVEDYLFSLIATSSHSDTPLINAQREVYIATRGADRSNKRDSPPDALPKDNFSTLQEALRGFLTSRERTIQFVNTSKEDLRSRISVHPIIGTVNCHEVLLLMAVHPARHAKQIDEIKAATAN